MKNDTKPTAMGQRLDGDNLQDVLDAGANASKVGRQQFFTPAAIATALMLPLPKRQASFVDLTMGDGALMAASSAPDVFGIDIDSRLARKPDKALGAWHCINGDLTRLYPLLEEVGWQFDLCGLNPPFSVRWHGDRLKALSKSKCRAVADTFGNRRETIDSTLATFLIALDRMSPRGEGFMICNESTAEKLFGAPESDPKLDARYHVWLWLTVPNFFEGTTSDMKIAVLYFARSHTSANPFHVTANGPDAESIAAALAPIATQRAILRQGFSIHNIHDCTVNTWQWRAVKEEWRRIRAAGKNNEFNIWLNREGKIHRDLTPFQQYSSRIPRAKVEALNRLEGQSPMALVVQRASRIELLQAVHSPIWRVQPELVAAVEAAVAQYASHRAPFYKLNAVQRLGYLDEEDTIICTKDGLEGFRQGESYPLTSETISIERKDERPNILGKNEKVTLSGKELCFRITDGKKKKHAFSPGGEHPAENIHRPASVTAAYWHDLETLIAHFRIPEVPDVSEVNPVQFQEHVAKIHEIEAMMNAA